MITSNVPLEPLNRAYTAADNRVETRSFPPGAVSWGAIAAGAAAGAALSLILLMLGVGLGLSSVSPWSYQGISATSFGVSTILWLTFTQLLSSAMGGYLAGRLRTKWTDAQPDEVYFRDTAHGFLAWAMSALATAVLLTSVIGSLLSGGIQAGASVVGGVANSASAAAGGYAATGNDASLDRGPVAYFVDSLFRRNGDAATPSPGEAPVPADVSDRIASHDASEVSRIFMNVSLSEPLPAEDVRYVGQLVAKRTGMSQQDAERRVTEVYAQAQAKVRSAEVAAREATDKARKASAYAAFWMFVSLLIGAFVASLAATYGGRQRDA